MSSNLTAHDLALLDGAVRCFTQFTHVCASTVWCSTTASAKRRLKFLEDKGLLKSRNVLASQPPMVSQPLCVWKPGEASPHCGEVSYQARKRWKSLPVVVNRVYYATDLGRGLLGRHPIKPPKDVQATHDLGLTCVYLQFLRRWPKLTTSCWLNESEYAHFRGRCVKVEDAMLCRNDRVLLMVDYAGAYRPDRVEALIGHAQTHNVPIAIY